MCAAPGSKTAQLVEFLHSDENNTVPGDFIVANLKKKQTVNNVVFLLIIFNFNFFCRRSCGCK